MNSTSSEQPSAAELQEGFTVSLRILSPSLDPNHRLVLEKLPLSTTVEEVKELITPLVPNQPSPEEQRLIYRGRPLLGTTTTLQNILEPPLDIMHTLHLVLPPGPQVSDNVYIGPDNALRYRNQPGRSPLAHASSTINTTGTTTGVQLTGQAGLTARTLATLNDLPPIQDPIPSVEHLAANFSTWQLLEQRQRRLEELERMRSMSAALATHLRNRGVDVSNNESNTQGPRPPSTNPTVPTPAPPAANVSVTVTHPLDASNLATMGPLLAVALARLTSQIRVLELEVEQDRSPALGTMSEIHRELHIISMSPSGQLPPETYQEVQSLLRRAETIMTRARQIHQSQSQLRQQLRQQQQQRLQQQRLGASTANANENQRFVPSQQPSEYYLVTTSSGEQMLLTPPAPSTVPVEPETTLVFPNQRPEAGMEVDAIGAAPNDILRNAVREAILNQQPVRNNNNDQFARNLRRFWLFMRLYFFCYLFTDSNTWERYLFAAFAAIIALFSESDFMNRLSSLTLQPVQRHLEGLIHGAPRAPPAQQDNTGQHDAPVNQSERHHEPGSHNRLQQEPQGFRRIERAFALFIASLVPGLGERQVEVQVAAEEAARNARQQEQAARDEAAAGSQGGDQAETVANQDEAQPPAVAEPEGNPGQH